MTSVVSWDPFRDVATLRDEVNRLFSRSLGGQPVPSGAQNATWAPPVDVFDTPEEIVLRAELPGLRPEDVDVELDENVLTISGERTFEERTGDERNYRLERAYGRFSRSVSLPKDVKGEEISAAFDLGVLEIRIPKADEVKPRKIVVNTNEATAE